MSNTNVITPKVNTGADILKFIMSVFVVATHTGLLGDFILPFVRLAVPVFFVLSGYFFFSKVNSIDNSYGKNAYLKKSVKHNLQLYAFWFIVLSPLTFYIRDYFSGGVIKGILTILHNFLLGSTFQASWYVTALITGLVILFFLSKKCSNTLLIIIGAVLYIPALLSSNYLFISMLSEGTKEIYHVFTTVFLLPCRNVFAAMIFLVLGKIIAEKKDSSDSDGYCMKALIGFGVLLAEILALDIGKAPIKDTDCFVTLPFIAYYLCRWVLSLNVKISCPGVLRKLSTLSYCSHMAVFMIVGKLLSLLDIPDFENIIVFALTLLLTWAVGLIILKLESFRLFGFLKYSH